VLDGALVAIVLDFYMYHFSTQAGEFSESAREDLVQRFRVNDRCSQRSRLSGGSALVAGWQCSSAGFLTAMWMRSKGPGGSLDAHPRQRLLGQWSIAFMRAGVLVYMVPAVVLPFIRSTLRCVMIWTLSIFYLYCMESAHR